MSLFLSFEGPDGSGKSTQARMLAEALRARGLTVTETREPGGTSLGEEIRHLLLDPAAPPATPLVMALLLSASRAELIEEVIEPALRRGEIVIADRYAESTTAYQAFGQGLALDRVRELTRIATDGLRPDAIVYVDIPPAVGLDRVATRGGRNRLDARSLAFHERVRAGYRKLIEEEPNRWICVDGQQSPEAVHRAILEALHPLVSEAADAV